MDLFRVLFISALVLLACLDHSNGEETGWFSHFFGDHRSGTDKVHDGVAHIKEGVTKGAKTMYDGVHHLVAKTWHGTTDIVGGLFTGLQGMMGMRRETTADKIARRTQRVVDEAQKRGERFTDRIRRGLHDTVDDLTDPLHGYSRRV